MKTNRTSIELPAFVNSELSVAELGHITGGEGDSTTKRGSTSCTGTDHDNQTRDYDAFETMTDFTTEF